jgi:hypothetical protein
MTELAQEEKQLELKKWRQGDVAIGQHSFVFRFNPLNKVTSVANEIVDEGIIYAEEEVAGIAVLTQTCDLIRDPQDRPFVEVCPLIKVDQSTFAQIRKRGMPRYAEIPSQANSLLVAHLDRVMTIEKPVLLEWQRVPGCRSDEERRRFSEALARKSSRVALPNKFNEFIEPLKSKFRKIHTKTTDEATILNEIAEIRVHPSLGWDIENQDIYFWYILTAKSAIERSKIEEQVQKWTALLASNNAYRPIAQVTSYSDMSAAEYLTSDHLDYDNLSSG